MHSYSPAFGIEPIMMSNCRGFTLSCRSWYTTGEMDRFWDFHTKGDPQCDACVVEPTQCEVCDGLVHTHLNYRLEAVQAKCDQCECVEVPGTEE